MPQTNHKKKQTIKQILKQIVFDSRLNPDDFFVIYRGTGEKHIKIKFTAMKLNTTGFFIGDTFIPYHRILLIGNEKNNLVLLDRIRHTRNK